MTLAPRYQPRLEEILIEASRAYRARNDVAFRRLLEDAAALAPMRLDVRHCLASHHIQTDRPEAALAIYQDIRELVPGDADNLFRLAHWLRFAGDVEAAEAARGEVRAARPDMAGWLGRMWRELDDWCARPVTDALPEVFGTTGRGAVLVLGYQLGEDGTARPSLIARLEKGLEAAKRFPWSAVIVSGGVPRGGRVEATVMREWLVRRGVAAERIWEEGYARDSVENLLYARQIMAVNGIDEVLVVTAAGNVRRVGSALRIMGWMTGWDGGITAVSSTAEMAEFADDGGDRLKAYREVLRAYGMPMMAAYPHLAER